jgi:predicted LPLAT superfamily acyltransferase
MLTAHFGVAELTAPMLKDLPNPRPFHFVVYRDMRDQTEHFHQDQWRALNQMRFINSMDPISAGLKILAALQAHELVGLRADRAMSGRTLTTQLLGGTVELPAGPFMAAVLTGANVVSTFTVRRGWRRYELLVSKPRQYLVGTGLARADVLQKAADDFAADLEAAVKQYPYQWGNFFDLWQQPRPG